jgi:uncharacterized protein YndB with AHSA1/START domain
MAATSILHDTFVLERTYPRPPDRVFAALSDTAKKRVWYAEGEHHEVELFEMDFREGGQERLRYKLRPGTPFPGAVIEHEGIFQDIVRDKRVVMASTMALAGRRISISLITFDLVPQHNATHLVLTFQGVYFEGADGPQIRAMGWGKVLDRLAEYVK